MYSSTLINISLANELSQAKRDLQDQIYENGFLIVSKQANHSEHFDYKVNIKKQFYNLSKRK